MKTLKLLPALALLAVTAAACGEEEIETADAYVAPAPAVVETPAAPMIMDEPVSEVIDTPTERAADPRDYEPVSDFYALMPEEVRYRTMDSDGAVYQKPLPRNR